MAAFTGVAALALLVMMGAVIGVWFSIRKLQKRTMVFMDRWEPVAQTTQETLQEFRKQSSEILTKLDDLAENAKGQVGKVDSLITQLSETAHRNLERVDETMRKTMDRVDHTTAAVEKTVRAPMDQLRALALGVNAALQQLAKKRTREIDRIAADEEMFI